MGRFGGGPGELFHEQMSFYGRAACGSGEQT